jgi:hypothetical protein
MILKRNAGGRSEYPTRLIIFANYLPMQLILIASDPLQVSIK